LICFCASGSARLDPFPRAGVGCLFLFHHDPNHDDAQIDAMVAEARRQVAEAGSNLRVEAARELVEIVLRSRSKRLAA
jgi:hypothetical protein